jgi:hypothetical protein
VLDETLELLDLGKSDIDGQHVWGPLLSRSNGTPTATTHEPARLPLRLHHQARAS